MKNDDEIYGIDCSTGDLIKVDINGERYTFKETKLEIEIREKCLEYYEKTGIYPRAILMDKTTALELLELIKEKYSGTKAASNIRKGFIKAFPENNITWIGLKIYIDALEEVRLIRIMH